MRDRNETNVSSKLTFLLVGGGIGAVIALLFAPKAGPEMRQDIASAARKGAEQTRDKAQLVKEQASVYYDTAKEQATSYYGTAREKVGEVYQTVAQKAQELPEKARQAVAGQTAPVTAAIEAGQEAYQENSHTTM